MAGRENWILFWCEQIDFLKDFYSTWCLLVHGEILWMKPDALTL